VLGGRSAGRRGLLDAVGDGRTRGPPGGGSAAVTAGGNYGAALTEAEAARYRETFFAAYPGLRRWHRSVGDGPVDTRTLAGRRRVGVTRFTEKLNAPAQGTAADRLKRAMGLLWERRGECPAAVSVLFVHDEVVAEAPADATAEWLKRRWWTGWPR
jgi:DNA polymerase-1